MRNPLAGDGGLVSRGRFLLHAIAATSLTLIGCLVVAFAQGGGPGGLVNQGSYSYGCYTPRTTTAVAAQFGLTTTSAPRTVTVTKVVTSTKTVTATKWRTRTICKTVTKPVTTTVYVPTTQYSTTTEKLTTTEKSTTTIVITETTVSTYTPPT